MAALRGLSLAFVKEIKAKFDPFHPQAVTAREFLRILSSEGMKSTNPKCKVFTELVNDRSYPGLTVTFSNKEIIQYNIDRKINCDEVLKDLNLRCKTVQQSS